MAEPAPAAEREARVVAAPLEPEERRRLLDRVEEIQESRASRRLRPHEVPKVLLAYQAAWHADPSRIRIAQKSRRIGFSWGCLAAEAVLEAGLNAAAGGMDQFYMGFNKDMAAEFIGDCAFFARAYQNVLRSTVFAAGQIDVRREVILIEDERRDLITYSVRLASGHRVEALSSNPHNWRGKQGHPRIDEAAFHGNLREVVKGALALLMWGGRVDIVSTHNGEDNEFNQLVKRVAAGQLPWSLHSVSFDRALQEGLFRRICLVRGVAWSPEAEAEYRAATYADYPNQEDAAEELDVQPKRGSGVYFPRAIIERAWQAGIAVVRWAQSAAFVLQDDRLTVARQWFADVVKPVLDAMPAEGRTALGQDFGRSGDLSVIVVLCELAPGRWRTGVHIELRNIPFDVQQLILFLVIEHLPYFFHGNIDARGNGQAHAEAAMQRFKPWRISCVMLSAGWYAEFFPLYKAAVEAVSIVLPMAEDVATDHRRVVLSGGRPTMDPGKDKGSDGGQRHGDSAVAYVLAWAATLADAQPAAGATVDPDPETFVPEAAADRALGIPMFVRRAVSMFGRR
ncbi:hypothetical protein [Azospirillum sp. A39]|uniref:hypothetical protein n=1 Tax=Azospirillum sp. A39 TaxID=3462279 RepID=UPI0040462FCC